MTTATADDFNLFKTETWSLSGAFKKAAFIGTIGLATGFIGGIFWQLWIDPIFFPILHDTSNITAQAWVLMINETFSFVPDLLGLTGDGGFLNTDFMQARLAPSIEALAIPDIETITTISGGIDAAAGTGGIESAVEEFTPNLN